MEEKKHIGKEIESNQYEDGSVSLSFISNGTSIFILPDDWENVKQDLKEILEKFE